MVETAEGTQGIIIEKNEVEGETEVTLSGKPRVVFIGDIHLFAYKFGPVTIGIDGTRAVRYLRNIPDKYQPDVFVLNGDAFDLSSQPNVQFSLEHCKALFDYLHETGKKVVYLSGNHDKIEVLDLLRGEFGDFIEFGDSLTIKKDNVDIVKVQHGHEVVRAPVGVDLRDDLKKEQLGAEGELKEVQQGTEDVPIFKRMLKRTLFAVLARIPLEGPLAIVGNNVVGGWINRWRFIPKGLKSKIITTDKRMREHAEASQVQLHIMAHTHTVAEDTDAGFINPGSFIRVPGMKDRFVAVHLDENGIARLIDCVKGRETTIEEIYELRIVEWMKAVGRVLHKSASRG